MAETPKEKSVIRETDDEARRLARGLVRCARHGALAALEPQTGHPLASRVAVAPDMDGTPVMLASTLSGHTAAIMADPRSSLLLGEAGKGDPLAHPRITLFTRAVRIERGGEDHARMRRRYLARHPKAELYVDFGDFAFFRLEIERASLNGGFAKAYSLQPADMILAPEACAALLGWEAGAVAHMNEDHRDAVALYAEVLCRAPKADWRLASLDPEGMDLVAGDRIARLWFETPLDAPAALKTVLVDLARRAREQGGAGGAA
ncbi:HugZ family protein [Polymorphum gilvum]|uniref:Pyridoxamine 5'-phosphate oxidase family protein n=1 Tax=Polymorphum gilvum (strain LMG 25793 / CGMCC 1.9160 / SL003B-26A1) TaxID=991905 RepID=F2J1F9_POLGS|nr:HugZ family protein [Polymorphum gilvum]ADZ69741.1 Pyridoxamine 5'-phosphate oxidase family protein [Polymorphum gilvum SL003B-26A1]